LHPRRRVPHCDAGLYWCGEPRLSASPAQSRLPPCYPRSLGNPHWPPFHIVDDRDRHLFHANRIRAHSQKPPGRSRPSPRRWISILLPPLARSCSRLGVSLACAKIYDVSCSGTVVSSLSMAADDANDLRRALENNEIVPYFQPLVELRTGLLRGFEALARWQHPQRGLIPPNEFIPLAEKSGLHGLLTGKLLSTVFAAAKDIPDHLTLSVNISLTQLTDLTLPKHIFAAAQHANFPLQRLILEITECALVGNTQHAARIANELKEQGSRIALDDFGTGYSSLRHLQLLPFDELKIDASFVRSMSHTRESRKIAAAIVGLGNSLSLTTVAEGVENQTIADMLLWLGCDVGQGWLYGRPVPPEQPPEVPAEKLNSPSLPADPERSAAADGDLPLRLEALPTQRLAQLNA